MPGDQITFVGDAPVDGLTEAQVGTLLQGKEGTSVTMTVHRPSDNTDLTVTMTREKIVYKLVSWTMLPSNIAFVQLLSFSQGASQEMRAALDEAKAAGATSFILDLRGNPGGLGLEVVKVASLFLPEGSVVYQEQDANSKKYPFKTIGVNDYTTQPMVVLINANTASSAEILASALNENKRATTIGETTFGTGTGTTTFPLDDGSEVDLGVSFWFTPSGKSVWRVGLKPNQEVSLPAGVFGETPATVKGFTDKQLEASRDTQLKAAYDVLTSTNR
jgi:carboxyl-terminal processing protease